MKIQEVEMSEIPQFKSDYGDSRGKCSKCKTTFLSTELTQYDKKSPDRYCEKCLKVLLFEHESKIEAQKNADKDYKIPYIDSIERKQQDKLEAEREKRNEERKRKARIDAQKRYAETRKKPELVEKRNEYMRTRYRNRVEKSSVLPITSYIDEINAKCPSCKSERIRKSGYLIKIDERVQKYQCRDCLYTFTQNWCDHE